MTPGRAAKELDEIAARLRHEVEEAERRSVRDVYETARAHSVGTMTYAEMRRRDHPFARRHGAPQSDPSTIHKHRGVFYGGWQMEVPQWTDGDLRSAVLNESEVVDFLQGTRMMFARPITARVEAEVMPRRERRLAEAVFKALKG